MPNFVGTGRADPRRVEKQDGGTTLNGIDVDENAATKTQYAAYGMIWLSYIYASLTSSPTIGYLLVKCDSHSLIFVRSTGVRSDNESIGLSSGVSMSGKE